MIPVEPSGPTSAPIPLQAPSHGPDPAQAAKHVMDTGRKSFQRDDYNARMVALTDELGKGDAVYDEQLMKEIFKLDPNALNSWLTPERANSLRSSGHITLKQEGEIASAFTSAYNHGDFPSATRYLGTNPNVGGPGTINDVTDVDGVIERYAGESWDRTENAQHVRQFLDFIDTSASPDTTQFRLKYAQHLIDQCVLNPVVGNNDPEERNAAAGLAANLLGGDISHPELVVNTLMHGGPAGKGYSPEQIQQFMSAASRSNGVFGEDVLKVPAQDRYLNVKDINVPNGVARATSDQCKARWLQ